MPLRIGFDMDGVLADFESAYHDVEIRLFGPDAASRAVNPEREEEEEAREDTVRQDEAKDEGRVNPDATAEPPEPDESPRRMRRRRDAIWSAIRSTPDFWTTVKPIEEGAVRRLYELMLRHRWEVFFITQRPASEGETVQRQTQRWLVDQGFDLPSVLVIRGSRGAAAAALRLDYHVDDTAQHCVDIVSDSHARPILIVPEEDRATAAQARKLGIGTARSISECLDLLEEASVTRRGWIRSVLGFRF